MPNKDDSKFKFCANTLYLCEYCYWINTRPVVVPLLHVCSHGCELCGQSIHVAYVGHVKLHETCMFHAIMWSMQTHNRIYYNCVMLPCRYTCVQMKLKFCTEVLVVKA